MNEDLTCNAKAKKLINLYLDQGERAYCHVRKACNAQEYSYTPKHVLIFNVSKN